jgi:large subunit ribosomal protein L15
MLLEDGKNITIGAPAIEGAAVEAKVIKHLKGDKVIVFKKKRRKGYRVKNGHRQYLSEIVIEGITASGAKKAAPKAAAKPAAAKPAAEKAPAKAAAKPAAKAPAAKKPAEKREKSQILRLHHLRPAKGAKKEKTRKGLGEGSKGKTAGRGTKGTGARTTTRLGFEGGGVNLVMRTPKLRGFKNPFRVEYQVVNLDKLSELYPKGGAVTISDLVAKGAVRKNQPVKVLGNGELSVKLEVSVDKVSESAKTKIEAAGGSINA